MHFIFTYRDYHVIKDGMLWNEGLSVKQNTAFMQGCIRIHILHKCTATGSGQDNSSAVSVLCFMHSLNAVQTNAMWDYSQSHCPVVVILVGWSPFHW